VTGASRGIGRAIAERLGRDGATVVATYVANKDKAEEVVQAIEADGSTAVAVQVDMRQVADVRRLFADVTRRYGHIDILVNNAAGTNIFKPTAELTEDDYDNMFGITRGVYFALQEAARQLADGGRIVSISTGGTAMAIAAGGAYAGSKAAIEQFSKALAKEVGGRGITVNTVSPGVTATDGLVLDHAQVAEMVARTPLGRLGTPDDVASAVAVLVSDDARWITGQGTLATGGMV